MRIRGQHDRASPARGLATSWILNRRTNRRGFTRRLVMHSSNLTAPEKGDMKVRIGIACYAVLALVLALASSLPAAAATGYAGGVPWQTGNIVVCSGAGTCSVLRIVTLNNATPTPMLLDQFSDGLLGGNTRGCNQQHAARRSHRRLRRFEFEGCCLQRRQPESKYQSRQPHSPRSVLTRLTAAPLAPASDGQGCCHKQRRKHVRIEQHRTR